MKKIAVVYYSRKGETYSPGMGVVKLEKGHTAVAAEFIAEATGGDLFELETVKTYDPDHMKMIQEARKELEEGIRPELKSIPDISGYDVVFLGFPNWWNTLPMPVVTFLGKCDWSAKDIIPFVTSGGSGFGRSLDDLERYAPGARILPGKAFLGHEVESSGPSIRQWALASLHKLG